MKTNRQLLQVGDVFDLAKGMKVYSKIQERFVYSNRVFSKKTVKTDVTIGRVLSNGLDLDRIIKRVSSSIKESFLSLGLSVDTSVINEFVKCTLGDQHQKEEFDTNVFIGEYIVTHTTTDGGGTGHGPYDVYPNGHHVTAKKLRDGKFDSNGVEVNFYQTGSFTAMIKDVDVKRKMKITFE